MRDEKKVPTGASDYGLHFRETIAPKDSFTSQGGKGSWSLAWVLGANNGRGHGSFMIKMALALYQCQVIRTN